MWFLIKDEINRGDWINAHRGLEKKIKVKPDGYKEGRDLEKGDQADVWIKPWVGWMVKEKVSPCWESGQYESSLGVAGSQPLNSSSVFSK